MADIEWRFCKDCRYLDGNLCDSPNITPDLVNGRRRIVGAEYMRGTSNGRTALEDLRCGPSAEWFEPRTELAEKSIADQLRAQKAAVEADQ